MILAPAGGQTDDVEHIAEGLQHAHHLPARGKGARQDVELNPRKRILGFALE